MINRRHLTSLSISMLFYAPFSAFGADEGTIKVNIAIASATPYAFPPQANFQGTIKNERTRGAPVIVTVAVGIVAVSFLVDLVLDVYERVTNGTVLVDLRDGKLDVHNVPGGALELIVVSDSGVQTFQRTDITREVVKTFLEKAINWKP